MRTDAISLTEAKNRTGLPATALLALAFQGRIEIVGRGRVLRVVRHTLDPWVNYSLRRLEDEIDSDCTAEADDGADLTAFVDLAYWSPLGAE